MVTRACLGHCLLPHRASLVSPRAVLTSKTHLKGSSSLLLLTFLLQASQDLKPGVLGSDTWPLDTAIPSGPQQRPMQEAAHSLNSSCREA